MKHAWMAAIVFVFCAVTASFSQAIIADHTCIDIYQIPEAAVVSAKQQLHIGYGYTSHGSQVTSAMSALVDFMNSKGYTHDLFAYHQDGNGGALHLFSGDGYGDGLLDHDAGYYPNWVNETRAFLGAPNAGGRGSARPQFNVIMWAWCGQLSGYSTSDVYSFYLNDMNQLEQDYPGITFVYMTGHADGSGLAGDLHRNNQTIRNYCIQNNKVLFDFYDIECYDPDGHYFGDKYVNDGCYYDGGNWATEWQNAHVQGVDWFPCDAAHTEAVNGNMKSFAIWWLWARLAGWGGVAPDLTPPSTPQNLQATLVNETQVDLTWNPSTDAESGVSRYRVYRDDEPIALTPSTSFSDASCIPGATHQYEVSAVNGGGTESVRSAMVQVVIPSDSQPPSTPERLTAIPVSATQIDLHWNPASDNSAVAGYRVHRNGAEIANITEIHYEDSSLTPKTTYQYQVLAFDVAGNESALSGTVSATTLDPSQVQTTIRLENTDDVDDTFIYKNDPNNNYGWDCCPGEVDRLLIKFNLPAALNGKQILSAQVGFYVWNQNNFHDNEYIKIYPMNTAWDEYSATWNNASSGHPWTTPGGDADMTAPVALILHLSDPASWDHAFYPPTNITAVVQQWCSGSRPNHGLMVVDECLTGLGFKASEYSEGCRPFLEIVYTDKTDATVVATEPVEAFQLYGNYPNPFNAGTIIKFDMAAPEDVEIKVFDLLGREMQTLQSGRLQAGHHEVHFSAEQLASGVYIYKVRMGSLQLTGKMLLAR